MTRSKHSTALATVGVSYRPREALGRLVSDLGSFLAAGPFFAVSGADLFAPRGVDAVKSDLGLVDVDGVAVDHTGLAGDICMGGER